jgi:hypothetical protein
MHNGSKPYTGVLEAVKELKRAGKKMIILSNSSKRRENSHKMLVKREFCCFMHLILMALLTCYSFRLLLTKLPGLFLIYTNYSRI